MKRAHYIIGLLGLAAFALSGQVMRFHKPELALLEAGSHMMYVSRHIYLLEASVVNLMLGLYLQAQPENWRKRAQVLGSFLILVSPLFIVLAFLAEPSLGLAGRSWRTSAGLFTLLGGAIAHFIASSRPGHRNAKIDSPRGGL
jgi:hypothetical protein